MPIVHGEFLFFFYCQNIAHIAHPIILQWCLHMSVITHQLLALKLLTQLNDTNHEWLRGVNSSWKSLPKAFENPYVKSPGKIKIFILRAAYKICHTIFRVLVYPSNDSCKTNNKQIQLERLESDFRNHSFAFTYNSNRNRCCLSERDKEHKNSNKCSVPLSQTKVTHFGNVTNKQI